MVELPSPPEEIVLAHFIVSDDVERSRRFYTEVLGGRVAFPGDPVNVALANSWIVINGGGGPTDDKPAVTLETPRDPDRVSSFLNIRVKDIAAVYAGWSARGAEFLTPPKQHQYEKRCYIRDPDGHLIEVGKPRTQRGTGRPLTGRRLRPAGSPGECRDHRRNRSHRRRPVPRTRASIHRVTPRRFGHGVMGAWTPC
jgi:catechol 2,3-dioxygenase-like lactoylglutathione lyase family enzyme